MSTRYYSLQCENNKSISNYVGVTSVLSEHINKADGLLRWKANQVISHIENGLDEGRTIADMLKNTISELSDIQEETLTVGSAVHNLIEDYIKGNEVDIEKLQSDDRIFNGYMAFLEWEKDNVIEWIWSEQVVYSNTFKYAGCVDALAVMKEKSFTYKDPKKPPRIDRKEGSIYMIDFKTSNGFYSDYKLQLGGYAGAYIEMGNKEEFGTGILRLDKETGIPEWKDYTPKMFDDMKTFQFLVQAFWLYKKRKYKPGDPIKKLKGWEYAT